MHSPRFRVIGSAGAGCRKIRAAFRRHRALPPIGCDINDHFEESVATRTLRCGRTCSCVLQEKDSMQRLLSAMEKRFWLLDRINATHLVLIAEVEGDATAERWRN